MDRQQMKDKNIIGYTVVEAFAGIITRTEFPVYRTRDIALQEALREIEYRMLNDHPIKLEDEDKEAYATAQRQLCDGITMVSLPDLGDGHWDIYLRPIYRSTL